MGVNFSYKTEANTITVQGKNVIRLSLLDTSIKVGTGNKWGLFFLRDFSKSSGIKIEY